MTFGHSRPADVPAEIDRTYLDQLVQLNVRIPLQLRIRMDQFIDYNQQPDSERSQEAVDNNWPSTLQELTTQALQLFLATHPIKQRRGPKPGRKPPKPPTDLSKVKPKDQTIEPKGGEE